ncbi:restriction endonuclease subunit S [Acidovorax sp. HDW3]|uniref:restriction endonuclease subunit S n=1 Tax=Acidovorax sp. HDW3 TaxID=2714923 RepID=UPI001407C74E|nr:restriction endonuclease subunit S [Acidovorax sp. HDW3]QIL43227.1 restriction endonuclease subunit S [Acidovorax sp. HDW3]
MSWREVQLGDGIHVKHGFAFKGEYFTAAGEYMVLTPGNFLEKGGFRVRDGKERFYHADFPEEYLLTDGDLIVAMTEQGEGLLGSAARIPAEGRYLHNQRLGLIQITDSTLLDKRFLYWVFNNAEVRAQIRASATGAKVKHTAPERIKKVRLKVPELSEQQVIAWVLDSYDDLIATNQRRIALLEEAARRLYREWFVHLRFPGHEQVAVKDGVPQGWEKLPLSEVAEITMGQSPESKHYNTDGDGLPFHQGVTDFGNRYISHKTHTRQATRIAEVDDILCSVRAPVGRLNITRDKIAIGRGLSAMRSCSGHQSLLFYQLSILFFEEDMIGGGAIFASVGKKELFGQIILQPSAEIAEKFNQIAAEIDAQIENLDSQNRQLTQARDLLLPKLMSGQLDVSGIALPEEVAV